MMGVFCSYPANHIKQYQLDRLHLKNGTTIAGHIYNRDTNFVSIENASGMMIFAKSQISKIAESKPGESELSLGILLFERKQFNKAKELLERSLKHDAWNEPSKEYLDYIDIEMHGRVYETELNYIEDLIASKGLENCFEQMEKEYATKAMKSSRYRGYLHYLMAKQYFDQRDKRNAMHYIALAEKYGHRSELETIQQLKILIEGKGEAHRSNSNRKGGYFASNQYLYYGTLHDQKLLIERVKKEITGLKQTPPLDTLTMVVQHAAQHHIDPLLVIALIQQESAWKKDAVSSAGAKGLMQLMPGTAKDLGVINLFDPKQNVKGGVQYLSTMLKTFGEIDLALAAYNAGPANVIKYRGIPPFSETHDYIKNIKRNYDRLNPTSTGIKIYRVQ